jgi:undecaprenyl-diphosphatase
MDASLFLYINQGLQNTFLDASMLFITNRGYLLFIAVIAPLFLKDWRKGFFVFSLCFAGFFVTDNIVDILKHLIARPRPCGELQDVRLLVPCLASFSFPSAHASTSFAMASIIAYLFRRGAIPAFIIATLVAFSRIYVGVHYPSDVLVGAYLGVVMGGVIIAVHNRAAGYLKR